MEIKRTAHGDMMSDCTTNYRLEFDAECTVRDIINFALSHKKEWGRITIQTLEEVKYNDNLIIPKPICLGIMKFSKGELKYDPLSENTLNRRVVWGYANGGFGYMSYSVTV